MAIIVKKIQSEIPFDMSLIEKLSDTHSFLFCNGALYLAPKKEGTPFPKRKFPRCFVTDFDPKYESQIVQDWAGKQSFQAAQREFEEEEQHRLQAFFWHMCQMNEEMDNMLKEGGEEVA